MNEAEDCGEAGKLRDAKKKKKQSFHDCSELGDQMCAESKHHVFTVFTASAGAKQKEDDGDEAPGRGGWGRKQICFLSLFTDDAVCFLTFFSFLFLSNEALRQTGFSRMPASLLFFFTKTNK